MTSRKRTFLALNFEEPDRVPIDFWMSAGFRAKLMSALKTTEEAFLDSNDVDLRYIEGPAYVGPPLRKSADESEEDIWGVPRKVVAVHAGGPLSDTKRSHGPRLPAPLRRRRSTTTTIGPPRTGLTTGK